VTAAVASSVSEKRIGWSAVLLAISRLTVIVMSKPHDSSSTRRMQTAARDGCLCMGSSMPRELSLGRCLSAADARRPATVGPGVPAKSLIRTALTG
jgi:hypothetical protein